MIQEFRQSISTVHDSLAIILQAPNPTLLRTIDTAIEHIQDSSTTLEVTDRPRELPNQRGLAENTRTRLPETDSPEIAAILERYSNLLIGMVGEKIQSMSMAFETSTLDVDNS